MSAPERGKRERRDVGIHASKTWKSQGSREQRRRRRPRYDGHGRTTERRGGFKKGQTDARPVCVCFRTQEVETGDLAGSGWFLNQARQLDAAVSLTSPGVSLAINCLSPSQ
ncbi:hypothetical protein PABG_11745 [Paracoccidioides brasiliensis Pb03]|nr:hypothetical protein PABG_11745 [Paracoccidioides brasiliensis Pb03]